MSGLGSDHADWRGGPRAIIQWASRIGLRSIRLDAACPVLRPRELDRSARRDLASLLRREELHLSGADLWIPPEHFVLTEFQDRAIEACIRAMELVSELTRLNAIPAGTLSLSLDAQTPSEVVQALAARCDATGVRIADSAWPVCDDARQPALIGVELDPAAVLASGADPIEQLGVLAPRLVSTRLSDLQGGLRVEPGTGMLDLDAYRSALTISPTAGFVTLDLRQVRDQPGACQKTLMRWNGQE